MSNHEEKKKFITYGIRDPRTGQFVYIGQANDYVTRQKSHLRKRKSRPRVSIVNIKVWMYDALTAGIVPEFVILEEVGTLEDSLFSELSWVRKLREENHQLLNK